MTDAPSPPRLGPAPPPQDGGPDPKRPWTILGRLSKAVRAQNWFAVALELGIVVLGVVDLRLDTRGSRERLLDATTVLRERVETEIGR